MGDTLVLLQIKHTTGLVPQGKDIQVHLLILRVMGVHLLHRVMVVVLHHLNRVEDILEDPQQWMLRYSSGSMPWIKTEVGRLILRNCKGRLSMAIGVISARRPAG